MEFWLFAATLLLGIKSIVGEIRCYCNDASCVNKGYMCKSSVELCFLDLTPDGATTFRAVQGCAEQLPDRLLSACQRPETDSDHATEQLEETGSDLDAFRSRLVCCANDMCNYNVDIVQSAGLAPEVKSNSRLSALQAQKALTGKTAGGPPEDWSVAGVHHNHDDTVRRDIWFRAAVIAVPIAGVVILLLLVIIAVRLLRGDLGGHMIKSSSNHRPPRHRGVVVDESGDVRTVLAPPGFNQNWTDKELGFQLESTKVHKYEKFRPSSDCSESDFCDCCTSLAKDSDVSTIGNNVPV